jgi:hypothetical protein
VLLLRVVRLFCGVHRFYVPLALDVRNAADAYLLCVAFRA